MNYYTDYNIDYGLNDDYKQNFSQPTVQMQSFKQKQTEAEALELTYSHLGRLMQSAEMLAYKLEIINKNTKLKYQFYDSFKIADKKTIDTLRYDVINFLDFYEKAILLHNKNFKYVNPSSSNELINDLKLWNNKAAVNDKRFFNAIIQLIQTGTYDDSLFPDQNVLYEKAKLDNTKFKKDAGFWKTFSIPILKYLSKLTKFTKEKVKKNPNYKPDIHFGEEDTNNDYLKNTIDYKNKEIEINRKLNEINTILFDISNKKLNTLNLVDSVSNLNNLIIAFKNKYGDDLELDQNSLNMLKNLISTIKVDKKIYKLLNDLCIECDSESMQ